MIQFGVNGADEMKRKNIFLHFFNIATVIVDTQIQ